MLHTFFFDTPSFLHLLLIISALPYIILPCYRLLWGYASLPATFIFMMSCDYSYIPLYASATYRRHRYAAHAYDVSFFRAILLLYSLLYFSRRYQGYASFIFHWVAFIIIIRSLPLYIYCQQLLSTSKIAALFITYTSRFPHAA